MIGHATRLRHDTLDMSEDTIMIMFLTPKVLNLEYYATALFNVSNSYTLKLYYKLNKTESLTSI